VAQNTVEIGLHARDDASAAIQGVANQLKGLMGQMAALAGFGGLTAGFASLVKSGIEFNRTMEDTRSGIASVILMTREYVDQAGRVVQGQKAISMAFGEASKIQADLRKDALGTVASYTELAQAFNSSLAPATRAGVTNLDDVRKITVMATQAMAALGIPTNQAAQELRGLFMGETGPDNRLNQILRITKEDLAKVQGNAEATAKLFYDRLKPAAEAASVAMQSFSGRLSNLGDAWDDVAGKFTADLFADLKAGLKDVQGELELAAQNAEVWGTAVWTSIKAIFSPLGAIVKSAMADADARVKAAGGTWTEVLQSVALAINNIMYFVRVIAVAVVQAVMHPLDALRVAVGQIVADIAGHLADIVGALPGGVGEGMAEGLRKAAAAATQWYTESNKYLENSEKGAAAALDAWKANEAAILRNASAVKQLGDNASRAKDQQEEAASAFTSKKLPKSTTWGGLAGGSEILMGSSLGAQAETDGAWGIFGMRRADMEDKAREILEMNDSVTAGVEAGWLRVQASVSTSAESAAQLVIGTWEAMSRAFNDSFYSVITGRLDDLGDIFSGLMDNMAGLFSNLVTNMVQKWLSGQESIVTGWQNLNKSMQNSSGGLSVQGGVMAAGMGYGIGGMVGQGTQNNQIGGAIGAVVGGIIGSVIPIIGTMLGSLIGSVLGGIIGGLFNKNSEKFVNLSAYGMIGRGEGPTTPLGARAVDAIGGTQSAMGDVLRMTETGRGQTSLMNQMVKEYIKNFGTTVGAGSSEDLQKDLEYVLTGQIPRELMHTLFGQKARTVAGGGDGRTAWGAQGAITSWYDVGAEESTTDAPLYKMLDSLGFTVEKMNQVASQIDSKTPEEFQKYFSDLVGTVVTIDRLKTAMGKSRTGVWADFAAEEGKTPIDDLTDSASTLKGLFGEIGYFVGDAQVTKAKELLDQVNARWESELEYLREVYALQKQVADVTTESTRGIRNREFAETGAQRLSRWGTEAAATLTLMSPIPPALPTEGEEGAATVYTNPQQAFASFQKIKSLFDQATGYFVQLWQRASAIQSSLSDTKGLFDSQVIGATVAKGEGLNQYWKDAMQLQADYVAATTMSGEEQLSAIEKINEKARSMYDHQLEMIDALQTGMAALVKSSADFKWQMRFDMASQYGTDANSRVGMIKAQLGSLIGNDTAIGKIESADTPEEIQRITAEAESLLKTYWGMFSEDDPRRKEAQKWINQQLDKMVNEAAGRSAEIMEGLDVQNSAIKGTLGGTSDLLVTAMAAATTGMDAWVATLDSAKTKFTESTNTLADGILATNAELITLADALRKLLAETVPVAVIPTPPVKPVKPPVILPPDDGKPPDPPPEDVPPGTPPEDWGNVLSVTTPGVQDLLDGLGAAAIAPLSDMLADQSFSKPWSPVDVYGKQIPVDVYGEKLLTGMEKHPLFMLFDGGLKSTERLFLAFDALSEKLERAGGGDLEGKFYPQVPVYYETRTD